MHHLIWKFQFRVHSVLQNLNHSGLKINTINIHLRVRDEKPSNFDFYFVQFHWETRIVARFEISGNQNEEQASRVFLILFKNSNIPTLCLHVLLSTKHQNVFGSVVACLPLSSLPRGHPFGHGFNSYQDHFFFKLFYFFMFFLQNFHNFFNQSKLLILRWFFWHLSINTSILW